MGDPESAWNDPKWLQMMLNQCGDQRTRYYDALKIIASYTQQCPTTDSLHMAMIAREALNPDGDNLSPSGGTMKRRFEAGNKQEECPECDLWFFSSEKHGIN
jgi:hypothetical protein